MGKRFGRNQKRKMREELESLKMYSLHKALYAKKMEVKAYSLSVENEKLKHRLSIALGEDKAGLEVVEMITRPKRLGRYSRDSR